MHLKIKSEMRIHRKRELTILILVIVLNEYARQTYARNKMNLKVFGK